MARKWSNQNLSGALHFVTGNLINRVPVFENSKCCRGFLSVFDNLREEWPAKLIAYVLMPDHFHLIVNPQDGDIKGFCGALKSVAAQKILTSYSDYDFVRETPRADGSIHQVWQDSFKAQPLWSGWMIWQKINYIHANPVKARLVTSAKSYPWSSFRAFYFNSDEPLAVDQVWSWPNDAEKLSRAMKELGWRSYHKRSSDES